MDHTLYIIRTGSVTVYVLHTEPNIDVKKLFTDFDTQHGKGRSWWEIADQFLAHLKRDHGFQELDDVIIQKLF